MTFNGPLSPCVGREHPALRRTHRASTMLSGWLMPEALPANGGGTACMTLGCPDDFVAVRLGFANVTGKSWRAARVIGRASTSFNNYVTPNGDAPWVRFTGSGNGEETVEDIVETPTDGPFAIEVRGLGDSRRDRVAGVRWTWTNWTALRSLAPDPASGLRVLMLRALVPPDQTVTFANGQHRELLGNPAMNLGTDTFSGGIKFNHDYVTDPSLPAPDDSELWLHNHVVPGTVFPIVQFLTRRPGVAGIAVGDSHAQGTGTTGQFRNYGFHATARLNRCCADAGPFSMVNGGAGGLTSDVFFARLAGLLEAVDPSYAVLPGWTFNDGVNGVPAGRAAVDRFAARLIHAVELCRRRDTLPVVLTPFPRDRRSMGEEQMRAWHDARDLALSLHRRGAVMVDAGSVLGHAERDVLDGTYRAAFTGDAMHPNDAGHAAVGDVLAGAIAGLLNTSANTVNV